MNPGGGQIPILKKQIEYSSGLFLWFGGFRFLLVGGYHAILRLFINAGASSNNEIDSSFVLSACPANFRNKPLRLKVRRRPRINGSTSSLAKRIARNNSRVTTGPNSNAPLFVSSVLLKLFPIAVRSNFLACANSFLLSQIPAKQGTP